MKKLFILIICSLILSFNNYAQYLPKQTIKETLKPNQSFYFENNFGTSSESYVRGKRRWGTERLATEFRGFAFTGSLGFVTSALDTNNSGGFGVSLSGEYIFNNCGIGLTSGFFYRPGSETTINDGVIETTFAKGDLIQIPVFAQIRFMGLNDIIKPYVGFQTGVIFNSIGSMVTTVKELDPVSTSSFSSEGSNDMRFGLGPKAGILLGEKILYGLDFTYTYLFKKTKTETFSGFDVTYDLSAIHLITLQATIVVPF